jgi:hypothetical protein
MNFARKWTQIEEEEEHIPIPEIEYPISGLFQIRNGFLLGGSITTII